MPKFAVYQALMARNDWEAERQGRAMNLQAMAQLEAREKARTQEQLKSQEEIGKIFRDLQNMPINEQDAERVRSVELENRKSIINGIKKYNGDLSAYLKSGGSLAINNYKANVLESEEVQQAISNKDNLVLALKDMQDEKYLRMVNVQVPGEDENGNPINTNKRVSWRKAYQMYKNGEITSLPYSGSQKRITASPDMFKKFYKDADNPFGDNTVTESDIYHALLIEYGEEFSEQARDRSNEYVEIVRESGNPWNWGSERMFQDRLKAEQFQLEKRKFAYKKKMDRVSSSKSLYIDPDINQLLTMGVNDELPINPSIKDFWSKRFDVGKNEDGTLKFNRSVIGEDLSGNKIDLGLADNFYFDRYVKRIDSEGKPQVFLKVNTVFDAEKYSEGSGSPVYEDLVGFDQFEEGVGQNDWGDIGDNKYRGTAFIPITSDINNPVMRQHIMKFAGLKNENSYEYTATHLGNQGYNNLTSSEVSILAERMGMSVDEFLQQTSRLK